MFIISDSEALPIIHPQSLSFYMCVSIPVGCFSDLLQINFYTVTESMVHGLYKVATHSSSTCSSDGYQR